MKNSIKDLTIIAVFTAILFVQEEALSFLPNIQLTVLLILLYTKVFGFRKTTVIVILHVILDNLVMGSFGPYTPFMLIGWMIIPITMATIFKKIENPLILALLGVLYAFLYSWCFIIPGVFVMHVRVWDYLKADILFELLLAASSFISILWLYKPLADFLRKYVLKENIEPHFE